MKEDSIGQISSAISQYTFCIHSRFHHYPTTHLPIPEGITNLPLIPNFRRRNRTPPPLPTLAPTSKPHRRKPYIDLPPGFPSPSLPSPLSLSFSPQFLSIVDHHLPFCSVLFCSVPFYSLLRNISPSFFLDVLVQFFYFTLPCLGLRTVSQGQLWRVWDGRGGWSWS